MKSLRYSLRSQRDLLEIAEYIARDNPAAALKMLVRLEIACEDLARIPTMGFRIEDSVADWRTWPVGNYVIIYQPEGNGVGIIRVVHGARDLGQFLP